MIKLKLPFWNDQNSSATLIQTAFAYWGEIEFRGQLPLVNLSPYMSTPTMLNLIAWQRDLTRLKSETLDDFRNRVFNAFGCAAAAGSTAGFKEIFKRLRIDRVQIFERLPDKDWDVIVLRMPDEQLAKHSELLKEIIERYGRTCRRYEFDVQTPMTLTISSAEFSHDVGFDIARQGADDSRARSRMAISNFNHETTFDIAH